jgi:hypothetical protein
MAVSKTRKSTTKAKKPVSKKEEVKLPEEVSEPVVDEPVKKSSPAKAEDAEPPKEEVKEVEPIVEVAKDSPVEIPKEEVVEVKVEKEPKPVKEEVVEVKPSEDLPKKQQKIGVGSIVLMPSGRKGVIISKAKHDSFRVQNLDNKTRVNVYKASRLSLAQ